MNLLHDREPGFNINDLQSTLPGCNETWIASTAQIWRSKYDGRCDPQSRTSSHSLADLFGSFKDEQPLDNLSLVELGFLLQPLQTLIYHVNKTATYFSAFSSRRLAQSIQTQLEESRYLLERWYTISRRTLEQDDSVSINACTTMTMFHLISLNTFTYLPDIEQLARGEIKLDVFETSPWGGKRYAEEAHQIWCHCGQVIRYFRKMRAGYQPYWWSGAIYRVALCLWATHLSVKGDDARTMTPPAEPAGIAVDMLPFDHSTVVRYLRRPEGKPMLSQHDGTLVRLQASTDIIWHCVEVLKENRSSSQLDEEIIERLARLAGRWELLQ
jgi:hypothetical protein